MEIAVIAPGTYEQEFTLMVKIGTSVILYNASPGTQRYFGACRFVRFEAANEIILMDHTPEALEGLIGMLNTIKSYGITADANAMQLFHRKQPVVNSINGFTKDVLFTGQLVEVQQTVHNYKDYSIRFIPIGGTFITVFETRLVVKKQDRAKIKQLNLNRIQSKELYQQGFLELPDKVIRIEDFRLAEISSGNIVVVPRLGSYDNVSEILSHFVVRGAENVVFTPQRIEGLVDCHEYLIYQNKYCCFYPIADFSAYFYAQTGRVLSTPGAPDCQGLFLRCFPVFKEENELAGTGDADFLRARAAEKDYEHIARPEDFTGENELATLGTGACIPSKYNNVAGNVVNDHIIVDAGEGTLQQLAFHLRLREIDLIEWCPRDLLILITHEHADHYFGVCSFLRLYHEKYGRYPRIIANPPVFRYIQLLLGAELRNAACPEFITCIPVVHAQFSTAFVIASKGAHLYVSGDCRPEPIAQRAKQTVLHEGTFEQVDVAEAVARSHSTIEEAAERIQDAGAVGIFTHFSQRYPRDPAVAENCWKAADLFEFRW